MTPPRDRRQDRRMEQAADRQAAREADAFNLDRKQLVLNVFRDLAETART